MWVTIARLAIELMDDASSEVKSEKKSKVPVKNLYMS